MKTRYCTITGNSGLIKSFTDDLPCHPDRIMEACQAALSLFPDDLAVTLCLYNDVRGVRQAYLEKYLEHVDYQMFISLSSMTIHVPVFDFQLTMIIHEFGHAIFEASIGFPARHGKPFSYDIHELVAQFCQQNIKL